MPLLVGAVAGVPYLPTLANGFVWDDVLHIAANPRIESFSAVAGYLRAPEGVYYRPAVFVSFALDYALWGRTPSAFHLTNLILHVVNTALLVGVARRSGLTVTAAVIAGATFGLHPVQTEAVAYISGRTDLMMTTGALLACGLVLGADRARLRGGAAALAAVLSILSKESGYLLLPLLLWIIYRRHRERQVRIALALPAVVMTLLLFALRPLGWGGSLEWNGVAAAVLAAGRTLMTYLGLLLWPGSLRLDRLTPVDGSALADGAAIALVAAVLAASVYAVRRRGTVSDWVAWTGAFYLPVANVLPIYPAIAARAVFTPEHNLYAPLAGIGALIGLGSVALAARVARPRRIALAVAAALVCVALGVRTVTRTRDWHDEERLYRTAIVAGTMSPRIWYNYGNVLMQRKAFAEAATAYDEAVRQAPHDVDMWINLGVARQQQGQVAAAIAAYEHAATLAPPSALLLENLGSAKVRAGDVAAARDAFTRALAIDPSRSRSRAALQALERLPHDPPQ